MSTDEQYRLTGYDEAIEALRHRGLRQALYEESGLLMDGVIVNLHGEPHLARRRLENRLFRRDTALDWERNLVPGVIEQVLAPALADGRGDLLDLSRRTMMMLAVEIAGIDRPAGTREEFDDLYGLMVRLSQAGLVMHATGDHEALKQDGLAALEEFDERFYARSLARRRALIDAVRAGDAGEGDLTRDILTTLLHNEDSLDLPADVIRREVAYFPWVGSHSTATSLVHSTHHVFTWLAAHPRDRAKLLEQPALLQRFIHESLRLHPASPVSMRRALEDVELKTGARLPKGSLVIIDKQAANRDTTVFGADADEFNPDREVPELVTLSGVSFGSGFHACLGRQIAGGILDEDATTPLYGSIATMVRILLDHGARLDPRDPPELDHASTRGHFKRYPVSFGGTPEV